MNEKVAAFLVALINFISTSDDWSGIQIHFRKI